MFQLTSGTRCGNYNPTSQRSSTWPWVVIPRSDCNSFVERRMFSVDWCRVDFISCVWPICIHFIAIVSWTLTFTTSINTNCCYTKHTSHSCLGYDGSGPPHPVGLLWFASQYHGRGSSTLHSIKPNENTQPFLPVRIIRLFTLTFLLELDV